jgi:hypothetical protein
VTRWQHDQTVKALLGGYAGGVVTSAAQRAERANAEHAKAVAMLASLEPLATPLTDDDLAEMLYGNDQDYYGCGAVETLMAEIKRLKGLA